MSFCLRKELADVLRGKITSGELDVDSIKDMSPAQRLGYFTSIFNDVKTAENVNELIESKLLLKNQEQGLINATQQLLGLKTPASRDVISKINRIDHLLSPEDKEKFMGDVIAKKLGIKGEVTPDEAKEISRLAKLATEAKKEMDSDPSNIKNRIDYGRKYKDALNYIDSLKPQGNPFLSFSNWWNLPKEALTSILHFSGPGVQGWGMLSTKNFWKGIPEMFKYLNKDNFENLDAFIITHPDYSTAKAAKLGLTKITDKLSEREEAIQSSILQHVPILKELVLASSRSFTGFLNYVRFTRYVDLLNGARLRGLDVTKGSDLSKELANIVNDFTGRAALGKDDRYASAQPILNNVFFAPRKILATMNMFNPYLYVKMAPYVRQQAIRQLLGSLVATYGFLQLAQLAGAKIDFDPRSNDFGKVRLGNTTFDITGGNAIYARLWARLLSSKTKTKYGEVRGISLKEKKEDIMQYLENKLSPMDSGIWEYLSSAIAGKPMDVEKRVVDEMTPIFIGDVINLVRYDGANTSAYLASPLAMFGAAMHTKEPGQSWEFSESKSMLDFKKQVGDETFDKASDEYDNKFEELMDKIKDNPEYKAMSEDDKSAYIRHEENRIKKEVMQEHGFIAEKKKRKNFSILDEE